MQRLGNPFAWPGDPALFGTLKGAKAHRKPKKQDADAVRFPGRRLPVAARRVTTYDGRLKLGLCPIKITGYGSARPPTRERSGPPDSDLHHRVEDEHHD
jgi:hypothetical protein